MTGIEALSSLHASREWLSLGCRDFTAMPVESVTSLWHCRTAHFAKYGLPPNALHSPPDFPPGPIPAQSL
jgi:hypothetical protein